MSYKLSDLKGIGVKTNQALNEMGIYTLEDLINYFPRTYEMIGEPIGINDATLGHKALVKCRLEKVLSTRIVRRNLKITRIKFLSEGSIFYATFFNNPYIGGFFNENEEYKLYGKVGKKGNYYEMSSPKYAKLNDDNSIKSGLNPVYPLSSKNKIKNKDFRKFIQNALLLNEPEDLMPDYLKYELNMPSLSEAYQSIHSPKSLDDAVRGNKRLTFDEFCGFNLSVFINKNLNAGLKGEIYDLASRDEYLSYLPFRLTESQLRVLNDMDSDMTSGKKMNRLVQGDVGSGKTVVGLYGVYQAIQNGYQAVFCAPTKILSYQHFEKIEEIFGDKGYKIEFLHSKMTAKERKKSYSRIESGESNIIVGTHAVFSKNVKYNNLGFAIIDEQHRFGVNQRGFLDKKGNGVHTLVMSATPIPRTLTLSLYKDLDVSIIDKKPGGRKEIKTYFRDYSYYDRIYKFAYKEVLKNNQVYIVCPSIDSEDMKSASDTFDKLKNTYFKNVSIALVHGKMDETEKDHVMEGFYKNEISVLVATSVIEVGIDSKNATLIIIEGADRFGLASLHQLRGRVGRNNKESYCILLSENPSQKSIERLNFLAKHSDGFEIAMFDLKTRGSGDIIGVRQSGKDGYNVYKLLENSELFNQAHDTIEELVEDNTLENRKYLEYINEKYNNIIKNITWN